MEVVVPARDFCFDSTSTTPYASAPSSPKLSCSSNYYYHYTSAPTSPTSAAAIYSDLRSYHHKPSSSSPSIPFICCRDEKPSSPRPVSPTEDNDFAFDFSGHFEKLELTTADELFDKGKIRPLKPPPRLQRPPDEASPRPKGLRSPHHNGRASPFDVDPFTAAMMEVTRDRGRMSSVSSSSRSRKGSRSLSPLRRGVEKQVDHHPLNSSRGTSTATTAAPLKGSGGGSGSKKWRLRDWLLFRSASEGRVTGNRSKDPLGKYMNLRSPPTSPSFAPRIMEKKRGDDSRNSSFRSTDSGGSVSRRRSGGAAVSPHAVHYTASRAAAEEMKKKTPLPYKQGLFSCLRFNPAVRSISRGFNSG